MQVQGKLAIVSGARAYPCDVADGSTWEAAFARLTAERGNPSIP